MNFIVIRPEDVSIFSKLFSDSLNDATWFVASLEACGKLAAMGMVERTHVIPLEGFHSDIARIELDADIVARRVDEFTAHLRDDIMSYRSETVGWDYLYLYFVINGYIRSRLISDILSIGLPPSSDYIFLSPDSPVDYHLDSSCYREIILRGIGLKGVKVRSIRFTSMESNRRKSVLNLAHDFSSIPSKVRALVSVPTLMYPRDSDFSLLKVFSGSSVDIESPFFDMPFCPQRVALVRRQEHLDPSVLRYGEEFERRVVPILKDSLPDISEATIRRIKERSLFQLNFREFTLNDKIFDAIENLIITNHDGGLQGPLLSWGNDRRLDISILPHSAIDNIAIPKLNPSVRSFGSRSKYGCSLYDLGFPRISTSVAYRRSFASSRFWSGLLAVGNAPPFKLLMIHNILDDYMFLPAVDLDDYRRAIDFLQRDVRFLVRHKFKPGTSARAMFSTSIVSMQDKAQAFDWADVVLGLGQPTSLLFEATQFGKSVCHVSAQPLGHKSLQLIPDEASVISIGSLYDGVAHLVWELDRKLD